MLIRIKKMQMQLVELWNVFRRSIDNKKDNPEEWLTEIQIPMQKICILYCFLRHNYAIIVLTKGVKHYATYYAY